MAHTLDAIRKRLEKGIYATDVAVAERNLGTLQGVIEKPKVWAKTKEEARGLSEQIRGLTERSEMREVSIPVLVPPPPQPVIQEEEEEVKGTVEQQPVVREAKLPSIPQRIADVREKQEHGVYREQPGEAAKNMEMLRKTESVLAKATGAEQPKLLANVRSLIEDMEQQPVVVVDETPIVVEQGQHRPNPCPILYDPCTLEPLTGMPELEKRVREIKKQSDTTPVGLYGLTNATTNIDFLMGPFLDKTVSLDDLVSFRLQAGGQIGSDIYEVLSRMFVFFGGIADVNPQQGGNYRFVEKFEAAAQRVYESPKEAFAAMTCKATSKSGISDITLVRSGDQGKQDSVDRPYCESECSVSADGIVQTYLMSVKWYKDEKSAEHYDLEKLKISADAVTTAERKPVEIIVFLKSKRDFERAHQRAYRQYVRHIGKTFFGWEEDVKPFLQDIRRQLFEEATLRRLPAAKIMEEHYFVAGAKPTLGLQLHQEIITQSACNAIENRGDNRYLVGVLPRGGKTYIAGGIIREYLRRTEARTMNILWLTAAPTETRSQVGHDLIQKFQDFAEFEFVDVRDTVELKKSKQFTFFFCSTQLLTQRAAKIGKRNRDYLQTLLTDSGSLGMIFYDEAHKTATGGKTKEEIDTILEIYATVKLPLIFLTATYYNILFEYRILVENTFIWDYTDVLKTRGLATSSDQAAAIQNLKERFQNSELVSTILERRQANGETIEAMGKPYLDFPELYFLSADIQEEAKARFESQAVYRPDTGFSMKSIFATRANATMADIRTGSGEIRVDAFKVFDNLVNPRNMVSLLTPDAVGFGDGQEGGEPLTKEARAMLEPTMLGRINTLSRSADSRFRLDENPTLMMFMPTGGVGSHIYFTLCAWASLLMAHPWWKARYEVACVVDPGSSTEVDFAKVAEGSSGIHVLRADPKAQILALERKLHCPGEDGIPKGLVVLAGQKLSMGVSLPCTDVVFLLNDSKSPDDIIQKMYRGLTPSPGKKAAFVVDLNPVRSLAAIYGYTRAASEKSKTSSAILDIIYDTYSWDADVFDMALAKGSDARPQSFQDKLRELFNAAEKDPEYRINEDFGGIDRQVGENIQRFVTTQMLSAITEYLSERKVGSQGLQIKLRDGASASLKGGQLVIRTAAKEKEGEGGGGGGGGAEEVEQPDIVIDNFIEAVKDFVKYLAITSQHSTLEEAIQEYASDEEFQRNVNDLMVSRGAILRADPRIVEVMILTIQELYKHSRGMVRMYGDTKAKIDEPSTRKNAVLKIIHQRLTPRKKQKEEKGEVFTPIELINKMLDHLPNSVWSNPDLKWLDPANGIGNFPVVAFYRLDEGLTGAIPNANTRRKHIIENMLFMVEIQSSNSRIARNIFMKICQDCIPNIWTVDSLSLNSETLKSHKWPEQFDIIMGNPPFNAGGLLKGGGTLWPKFVQLAFNLIADNGYICFIHPPGWRKFYDPEDRDNQGKLLYTIKEKGWNLDYLNVSDQPPPHFPIVDYYVIHAKKTNKSTKYDSKFMGISGSGNTKLEYGFIPNMLNDETMSILNKLFNTEGEPIHIVYNQVFKPTVSDKDNEGIQHYHFTSRTGEKQIYKKEYTSVPEYITKEKVIMTYNGGYEKGRLFAFYSDENLGTTNNSMYMLTKSKVQGDKLVKFFNSDIITFLMKITQYSASPNHKNEFKILNKLKVPDSLDYGLTEKEKELIEKIVGAKEVAEGGARRSKYSNKTRKAPRKKT